MQYILANFLQPQYNQYRLQYKMFNFLSKQEDFLNNIQPEQYLYFDETPVQAPSNTFTGNIEIDFQNIDVASIHVQDFALMLKQYNLTEEQAKVYQNKFLKTKRIYKREKAKKRTAETRVDYFKSEESKNEQPHNLKSDESETQDKCEDKKRKKRISAQISRDRKKIYLEQVEDQNRRLKIRCEELQKENKDLKKQLSESKKKSTVRPQKSLKSIIIMSLILLTSVNKRMEAVETDMNVSREILIAHSNQLLNEYIQELPVKINYNRVQLEQQLQKQFLQHTNQAQKLMKQEVEQRINAIEFRSFDTREEIRMKTTNYTDKEKRGSRSQKAC